MVIAGNANMISRETNNGIQVKTGMRIIFMPGARMLRIVATKFMAAPKDAMPRICRPRIQKSVPMPVNWRSVSGA